MIFYLKYLFKRCHNTAVNNYSQKENNILIIKLRVTLLYKNIFFSILHASVSECLSYYHIYLQ